jgi:hypothetical protein
MFHSMEKVIHAVEKIFHAVEVPDFRLRAAVGRASKSENATMQGLTPLQAGELLRLKPGLYVLAAEYRKTEAHPFVVASLLHGPSHISLETALAHHGLVPEAVYQVASVTSARSRTYPTPVGVFTFQRVPADDPRAGVEAVKLENGAWAFIASPLRAIADMVYLNRRISWEGGGIGYLTESLRMEPEDLAGLSFRPLESICRSLRNRRTRDYVQGLHREVKHGC